MEKRVLLWFDFLSVGFLWAPVCFGAEIVLSLVKESETSICSFLQEPIL